MPECAIPARATSTSIIGLVHDGGDLFRWSD
jgi:hypothetical protein